ncbi:MAG: manganese catalase family protein [Gaiellaceae bacterium]
MPPPSDPDPAGAAAAQELLGARFGEMSTFLNYTFQSFNFRTARERGRSTTSSRTSLPRSSVTLELVAAAINTMLTGASPTNGKAPKAVLAGLKGVGNPHHFLVGGAGCPAAELAGAALFSPKDYLELAAVFNGPHPETGEDLVVVDEAPEGVPAYDLPAQTAVFAPDYAPEDIAAIAERLRKMRRCVTSWRLPSVSVVNGLRIGARQSTRARRGAGGVGLLRAVPPKTRTRVRGGALGLKVGVGVLSREQRGQPNGDVRSRRPLTG